MKKVMNLMLLASIGIGITGCESPSNTVVSTPSSGAAVAAETTTATDAFGNTTTTSTAADGTITTIKTSADGTNVATEHLKITRIAR